jgi:lytic murein transglycosylase
MHDRSLHLALVAFALLAAAGNAEAAPGCGGNFQSWLSEFRRDASEQGISPRGLAALDGITPDQSVISRDRGQHVFQQSFEEFSGRMVPPRMPRAENMMKKYGSVLGRIEKQYGVPGSVLVAIWGLETDFGANIGTFPTIRSIATLAYDCRRSEMFRSELVDALRIVDRGDLEPAEMRGAWAGEMGQTQFMPSSYMKYAVDFEGTGRRDLLRSAPDVLASTANYLSSFGWKRGQPWDPGSANFDVLKQWNKSDVYARTVAAFANRLDEQE